MRRLILKILGIEDRIAALEARSFERVQEIHKHFHNPAQTWLDSLPDRNQCTHCLAIKSQYCFDGLGRVVCADCKPEHYLDAAQRGIAKGI
jgi:hypothetical protein